MNDIEDDIRIRDALKSQESQMRLFADNIPGPIAYLDRSLKYTFVNQAFANSVCQPQDEIYGKTPFEVMASDVASFIRPIVKRAQGGEHVEYERIGTTPQGQNRWMHGRIAPDLDVSGTVRGLYCTEYDIHDLKLTEQALAAREEQLRLFTDNIPEPVVYLDEEPPLRVRQRVVPAPDGPRPRQRHRPHVGRGRRHRRLLGAGAVHPARRAPARR